MSIKLVAAVAVGALGLMATCAGLTGAVFGSGNPAGAQCLPAAGMPAAPSATPAPAGRWTAQQAANATAIVAIGVSRKVPPRGWVIALATAMQESNLNNLGDLGPNNDHDSLGLFQQRPSQGWGTPAQIMDPAYAAGKFYEKLVEVPDWEKLPLTVAAQAVQRSAFPNAYAKWEPDAQNLLAAVTSGFGRANPGELEQCPSNCPGLVSNPAPTAVADGQPPTSASDKGCASTLTRARTWLTAWNGGPVPYLNSSDPATWFGGYRRDCSGYASMALGLQGPGLNTAGLAARSRPLLKTQLRGGDLLINPAPGGAGHVVIFERWTDTSMNSYMGYEQSGDGGTHYRRIPYPYFGAYQMAPFRLS